MASLSWKPNKLGFDKFTFYTQQHWWNYI